MDDLYNKVARRRRRGEGGFTLIELLVVIAVLAVLAFIVIFNVSGVANRGNAAACATDVKSVQTALDAAQNDGVAVPITNPIGATTWAALVPGYLHTQPNTAECAATPMGIVANGAGQGDNVVGA
jgi:prepilin-type N-terminal cleavage/methylation domain-containing protein